MTDSPETRGPTRSGIAEARALLDAFLPPTPLIRCERWSESFGAEVWIKNETISPISSFKLRGALVEMLRALERSEVKLFVTSSSGNHGQGVAYAARLLKLSSCVFLPKGANPLKKAMIESFGADVREIGDDLDDAKEEALRFASEHGGWFVDDGEGLGVMEGGGTVGLEVGQAMHTLDTLFVPMGSGSLVSGCACAVKSLHPAAKVIAVQAKGSPAMVESFRARRPLERSIATLADGLVCRKPAALALQSMLKFVDDALLVEDRELLSAVQSVIEDAHVLVEPSGAAALVGAWKMRDQLRGRSVVLVLTGSNITREQLHASLAGPSLFEDPRG